MMKKLFKNDLIRQQVAQGVVMATVLCAVMALGSACAPVTNSVSKLPSPTRNLPDVRDSGASSEIAYATTHFVATDRYGNDLPGNKGLPHDLGDYQLLEISEEQVNQLRENGITRVQLGQTGTVEVHTVVKVVMNPDSIDAREISDRVKAAWSSRNLKTAEYALSLIEDKNSDSRKKAVMRALKGLSVYYRAL